MRKFLSFLTAGLLLTFVGARTAEAQTFNFGLRLVQNATLTNLADGSTVTFPADHVGATSSAQLQITYKGATPLTAAAASITQLDLTGATDFSISGFSDVPFTLNPNQSFSVNVVFKPTTSRSVSGKITFGYAEGARTGQFSVNLSGVAPDFAVTYTLPNGNATPYASGDTVPLPTTNLNETSVATITLLNRGSGAGVVNGITLSGNPAFVLAGVPTPPTTVDPNKAIQFTIRYTPTLLDTVRGVVQITLFNSTVSIGVSGSGLGAVFGYEALPESGTVSITPGQLLVLSDAIVGEKTSVTIRVRNSGNADGRIAAISVAGTGFTLTDAPFTPLTLTPGSAAQLTVTFTPTQTGRAAGRLRIGNDSFELASNGLGPVYAYEALPEGGAVSITAGQALVLKDVTVGEKTSIAVRIRNTGNAEGKIPVISVTGAGFTLSDAPFTPLSLNPGATAQLTVTFTPTQAGRATGRLRVGSDNFDLSANALGPVFTYEALPESGTVPITAGQALTLKDVTLGEKTSIAVRVLNSGTSDARIPAISVTGAGFTLTDPPFTPLTLAPNASVRLTVTFTPTQVGRVTGILRIGGDSFDLSVNALGPNVVYSYVAGAGSFTLAGGGTAVFSPVSVGQTGTIRFTLTNDGAAATSIHSISVVTTGTIFGLTGLPALPANLAVGASVSFNVTFTPTLTGTVTGSLKVDTQTFTLSGAANPPAALPNYTFPGSTGVQEPLTQPAFGLTLASRYPLALSGTFTLAFNSEVFSNDPAVQFAVGGRTVNFTIPAGSTQAVFQNNATTMRIQTGTVAGTITVTPSFATTEGGISLTPTLPPALSLSVGQSAPRLLNVALTAKTATSFSLLVTGYATGRAMTSMDFTFTPTAGETVQTNKVTINVEPSFTAWYQGTASQAFGSQFTVTVPFNVQGDVKNVTNITDTLQSVAVTITNRQGTSASRSIELR